MEHKRISINMNTDIKLLMVCLTLSVFYPFKDFVKFFYNNIIKGFFYEKISFIEGPFL